MTGIGEKALAQPVKPPLRERCACLAKLVKKRLTLTVLALARTDRWRPPVEALSCIKGIDTLTAFRLAAEAGSFTRFRTAPAFASWCGLVPSERSSGETERRGGITKTATGSPGRHWWSRRGTT